MTSHIVTLENLQEKLSLVKLLRLFLCSKPFYRCISLYKRYFCYNYLPNPTYNQPQTCIDCTFSAKIYSHHGKKPIWKGKSLNFPIKVIKIVYLYSGESNNPRKFTICMSTTFTIQSVSLKKKSCPCPHIVQNTKKTIHTSFLYKVQFTYGNWQHPGHSPPSQAWHSNEDRTCLLCPSVQLRFLPTGNFVSSYPLSSWAGWGWEGATCKDMLCLAAMIAAAVRRCLTILGG